jgi:hypothetical protein
MTALFAPDRSFCDATGQERKSVVLTGLPDTGHSNCNILSSIGMEYSTSGNVRLP